jgi:hypothetical protein
MRETEHAAASTIRRRLAALSSLYKHLVRHGEESRRRSRTAGDPRAGRDAPRIGEELQRRDIDHSPRDPCRMSGDHGSYGASTPVIAKAAQPQSRHQWSASSVDNPVARQAHGRVP